MRASAALFAAALLLPQLAVHAQDKKDSVGRPTYKVEFNIRDSSDTADKTARHYMLLMDAGRKTVLKMGTRVPVATGSFQPSTGGTAVNPLVGTQYTYLDVGLSIECLVSELNGRLVINGNLDLSTVVQRDAPGRGSNPANPTVTQTRLDLDAAIEPGKPTVIAAIDDPVNSRQFQLEATITRVN